VIEGFKGRRPLTPPGKLFEEKDDRKRSPSLSRRLDAAVSGKPENAKHRSLDSSKTFGKFMIEFVAVLFCPNGTVFHMGPLPQRRDAKDCFTWEREEQAPPLPSLPFFPYQGIAAEAMFRLRRNGEFVLPPCRRHFASVPAKHRGFCEAVSLTTFGPHGQNKHKLRGYIGGYFPLCTFSSLHFFVV